MHGFTRRLVLGILAASAATSLVRAQGPAAAWWAHVQVLADDGLLGRSAGSDGHRKAAEYVADQFQRVGLRPGMPDGYLQPVRLRTVAIDRAGSRVAVTSQGRETVLDLATDIVVSGRGACGAVAAPLTFVGYGLSIPELGHDDLAGQDLRGRIAVFVPGAPSSLSGTVVTHRQAAGERWRLLKARGALGAVALFNPHQPGANWERTLRAAAQPANALTDAEEFADRPISALVGVEAAARLFEGSGRDVEALLAQAKEREPLPRFPLQTSLHATLRCTGESKTSESVLGVFEGSDPSLRDEVVVLTAHLDHVGQSGEGDDTIYNGAMDNASGVASLIDLASRIRAAGVPLRRTLLLAAVTAEEGGLLGSYYLAAQPPLPRNRRFVANINLDMFLPIIPMRSLIAFGMEESSLEQDVEAAAASVGVKAERDPVPQQNLFVRSDQYNFVRTGVPAVMLLTGAGGDRELWKTWEQWMATHYHKPSDDLRQPINFESADMFQRALVALVQRVANADAAPRWHPSSPFRPASPDVRPLSATGPGW